jgi:hypothetical protein
VTDEALADRCTNYADGLVAAMFIFMTGVAAAVGSEDTRCMIAAYHRTMIVTVLVGGGVILSALQWLCTWSSRLRKEVECSEDARRLQKTLHRVRVSLVCLFSLGTCVLLVALEDNQCPATL